MGIVSDILGRIDSAVVSAGSQLFKNSADSLHNVLIGMCTAFLAVIGIMMVLGISKMTTRETLQVVSVRCPRSDGVMEYLLDVHH